MTFYAFGFLKPERPDKLLKLSKPVSPGTYVLAQYPEGRKEVFLIMDYGFKSPFEFDDLPVVLRKANSKEITGYQKRLELEKKGYELCERFAKELGLEMNLVDVECFFDRSKIIFYYTAEGRIDFRELVKQLARVLRMRIEMRQIGVRNETSILGGIGICGKEFCCSQYLRQFTSLSIRMAKEQGLILDPNKISGPCGRLLCCLAYESPIYREFLANLPKIGSKITLADKSFRVVKYNFFQQTVILETEEEGFITIPVFELKNYIVTEEEREQGELEWEE